MVKVGGDTWIHLVPLLLSQGHLEQGAHDHIQMAFEDLQEHLH